MRPEGEQKWLDSLNAQVSSVQWSEQMGCAHGNPAPGPGKRDKLKELGETEEHHQYTWRQHSPSCRLQHLCYIRAPLTWKGANFSSTWVPLSLGWPYIPFHQGYSSVDKESSFHCKRHTLQKDSIVKYTDNPVSKAMEIWPVFCNSTEPLKASR